MVDSVAVGENVESSYLRVQNRIVNLYELMSVVVTPKGENDVCSSIANKFESCGENMSDGCGENMSDCWGENRVDFRGEKRVDCCGENRPRSPRSSGSSAPKLW